MKNKIKLNNILICIIVFASAFIIFPSKVKAGLTPEQQQTVANFAIGYVTNGNNNNLLVYSQDNRNKGYNNTFSSHSGADEVNASFENKLAFDCSSFVAFVYKETTGVIFANYNNGVVSNTWTTRDYYSDAHSNVHLIKVGNYGQVDLQPGDILWVSGHVALYVGNGKVAEASSPENGVVISGNNRFSEVYRLDMNVSSVRGYSDYVWPNGENYEWTDIQIDSETETNFRYNGIRGGRFDYFDYDFNWLLNMLKELLDWFIGAATYLIRMVFIGWTNLIETTINGIIGWTTGEDASFTIEKLVNNQVALLDVDFFNYKTPGGQPIEQDSVLYVIRESIAAWYYIIRSLSIILLLLTLIYIGIRIALTTIPEQKAKYKEMLISWVVSFAIVFGIHYLMIAILKLNSSLIEIIHGTFAGAEESLYDTVRAQSYTIKASVGWRSLLLYMILVYLLVRFLFVYIKRFMVVAVLTFAAPFMGVLYSIDKIKDNKSQSFNNWFKEYFFNVIVQSVHALLYGLFMSLAFNIAGESFIGVVFALLLINFMLQAESIFKSIFGIKSGSMKDVAKTALAITAAPGLTKKFVKANVKPLGKITKPITKPISDLASGTKMYRKLDKINKLKDQVINTEIKENMNKLIDKTKNSKLGSISRQLVDAEKDRLFNENKQKYIDQEVTKLAKNDISQKEKDKLKAEGISYGDKKYSDFLKSKGLYKKYGNKAEMLVGIKSDNLKDDLELEARSNVAQKEATEEIERQFSGLNEKEMMNYFNIDEDQIAKDVEKQFEAQAKITKQYRKDMMNQVLSSVKGAGLAATAIPVAVVSGMGEGLAVAAHAKSNFDKGINGYVKHNKNYSSDKKISTLMKDIATAGAYSKIKNVKLQAVDYKEDLKNAQNDALYEGKIKKLQESIDEQYEKLREKPNINIKQLDEMIEIANYTVSNGKISDALYKQSGQINLKIRMGISDGYENVTKNVQYNRKDVEFDKAKFKRNMDRTIKNMIAKDEGVKKKDITDARIKQKYESLSFDKQEEIVKTNVNKSIKINKELENKIKNSNSNMNLLQINKVVDNIKVTDMNNEQVKQNVKKVIEDRMKEEKKLNKISVDEYIKSLKYKDVASIIETATTYNNSFKNSSMDNEDVKKLMKDIEKLKYYESQLKG